MTLVPVSGLLATVVDLAEQDPDAADELVRLGLYESMSDQIEVARPAIEAEAVEIISKQAARARSALLREYVGKALDGKQPADATVTAQGLAIIDTYVAKGIGRSMLDFVNNKRDKRGRFAPVDSLGHGLNRTPKSELQPDDKSRRETATNQASERVKQGIDSGALKPDDLVQVHFSTNPDKHTKTKSLKREFKASEVDDKIEEYRAADEAGPDPKYPTGIAMPNKLPAGVPMTGNNRAAYDAMAGFTGPEAAGRIAGHIPARGSIASANVAENWNNASDGSDRRSYRRIGMMGTALTNASGDNSTGAMVGGLAQLIGELGPEAEDVLSPGFTRIAYRYRGTEKRPDSEMLSQMAQADRTLSVLDPDLPAKASAKRVGDARVASEDKREELLDTYKHDKSQGNKVAGVMGYYSQDRVFNSLTPDQRSMRIRGDMLSADLMDRVPDAKLADLSISSGQTPPSVGVMLDAEGKVVSEAMGFNGDHYLPFDLKNLKALHGGQYVRTRTMGGPTTEDIYTGLMTGARQLQVVSNSGVYTVEFDPDLRGGRRYSDKAKKMVERYGRILDAIGSNELYRQDLPAARKQEIWEQAMDSTGWDPTKGGEAYRDMIKEARLREGGGQSLTGSSKVAVETEAKVDAQMKAEDQQSGNALRGAGRAQRKAELMREQMAIARETAVDQYQLNGPGYHDALKALKTEFPYYIRSVKYEEIPQFNERRKLGPMTRRNRAYSNDRGYTPPGSNRASAEENAYRGKEAKAGIGGRGKWKPKGAAAEATNEADQEVDETTGSASATHARPALGGRVAATHQFGGVRMSLDKDTKPLTEILGPGKAASRQLMIPLTKLLTTVKTNSNMYGPNGRIQEPVGGETVTVDKGPMYVMNAWSKMVGTDRPQQFANWVIGKATDQERDAVIETLNSIPEMVSSISDVNAREQVYANYGGVDGVKESVKEAVALTSLASPFGPAAGDEAKMAMALPASGDPKPQPFPAVLQLGDKLSNYTDWESKAVNSKILPQVQGMKGKSDAEIGQWLTSAIEAHKQLEETGRPGTSQEQRERVQAISNVQQAWAFVRAKSLVESLGGLPKAQAPQQGAANPWSPPAAGVAGFKSASLDQPAWTVGDLAATYSRSEVLAYLAQG
jgi:hypothetical protein